MDEYINKSLLTFDFVTAVTQKCHYANNICCVFNSDIWNSARNV